MVDLQSLPGVRRCSKCYSYFYAFTREVIESCGSCRKSPSWVKGFEAGLCGQQQTRNDNPKRTQEFWDWEDGFSAGILVAARLRLLEYDEAKNWRG